MISKKTAPFMVASGGITVILRTSDREAIPIDKDESVMPSP